MSLESDVAEILAKVRAIWDVGDRMGWFGPRILPGDGSGKPADPPPPPPPPPPPVSGNVDETWDWNLTGDGHRDNFTPGRVYSFAVQVPQGYQGTLEFKCGEMVGSPRYDPSLSLWISETPRGDPVSHTFAIKDRPWNTGGAQTITLLNAIAGRVYYLNFKVGNGGLYLLRINHQ